MLPDGTDSGPGARATVEPRPQGPTVARGGTSRRARVADLGIQAAIVVVLGLVWQAVSTWFDTGFWTSSPVAVLRELSDWLRSGTLWGDLGITLAETLIGFAIGSVIGSVVGFALGWWRVLGDIFEPILLPFYALPRIALAPLFVLWFGIGLSAKAALTALLVFFIVFFTVYRGVRAVDRDLVAVARLMGASRVATWRTIVLPHAAIWILSGLRLGLPYSIHGAIIGEFIAASAGIGFIIRQSSATFDTAGLFAGVLVLIIVATLMLAVMTAVERRILRWQEAPTR